MNNKEYIGKQVAIAIDRQMGSKHPKHNYHYPVNYGYVPGTMGTDGEETDAYLLGVFKPVTEYTGTCIAVIHRTNDDDDKLIVVPENVTYSDEQINALTEFQEKYFERVIWR